jgi:hypothetical protein
MYFLVSRTVLPTTGWRKVRVTATVMLFIIFVLTTRPTRLRFGMAPAAAPAAALNSDGAADRTFGLVDSRRPRSCSGSFSTSSQAVC